MTIEQMNRIIAAQLAFFAASQRADAEAAKATQSQAAAEAAEKDFLVGAQAARIGELVTLKARAVLNEQQAAIDAARAARDAQVAATQAAIQAKYAAEKEYTDAILAARQTGATERIG